jgi:hypothetical protein
VEDLAVFLPLAAARALARDEGVNELRIFLRAGVSPRDAGAKLSRAVVDAAVVRSDRGDVADRDTHASLARHRAVAYVVMAGVAALCLLIAAHLDATERRVELATLVAIGASRSTILGGLLVRSAAGRCRVGAGDAAGAILAATQDAASRWSAARGPSPRPPSPRRVGPPRRCPPSRCYARPRGAPEG